MTQELLVSCLAWAWFVGWTLYWGGKAFFAWYESDRTWWMAFAAMIYGCFMFFAGGKA